MKSSEKHESFSGHLGFVLSAAGSAVGVGNLWRFPYLAAKDGGGLFLILYLILAATFGCTLLTSDISIGRKTGKSAAGAYSRLNSKWRFIGHLTFLVPVLVFTYYVVIGGWIMKYMVVYITLRGNTAAEDNFFNHFITSPLSSVFYTALFLIITALIVYNGIKNGIEKVSRFMMPLLLILLMITAGYALTLSYTDNTGILRTGIEGFLYYITPHLKGMTLRRFMQIMLDAVSQLFFSLSVSMGIMITYGSYLKPDVSIHKAVNQIAFFDSAAAFLAGALIVPSVYVFSGTEGMTAGTGLMFLILPKVFTAMGSFGNIIGIMFFTAAFFAALTSSISILETVTANCREIFHSERRKTVIILSIVYLIASSVIALGYSVFYMGIKLPNGATGQLLDVMDYLTNSIMMPLIAVLSAILIGWITKPDVITNEVKRSGASFPAEKMYRFMERYALPAIMIFVLLQSLGITITY